MAEVNVETKFKAALEVIQNLPKSGSYKPSTEMMLMFYSYYKQATEGRCNRAKPWSFDVINKAKWDAWNKLGNMTREVAMERYVAELTKIMKDFPQPTNEQIIEVLPATDQAANFVQSLGHFYEIVDPQSGNAKQIKEFNQSGGKLNGNGNVGSSPVNGDSQPSNGFHDDSERDDVTKSDDASSPVTGSDDEFCDTSDVIDGNHGNSPSTSSISSASVDGRSGDSPERKPNDAITGFGKAPVTHGGEPGTHGIDEAPGPRAGQTGRAPTCDVTSRDPPERGSPLLAGSSGGGEDRSPPEWGRQSEVQERIAVALLQLQRDMQSVLTRLATLETIAISRQQERCPRCCAGGGSGKRAAWWPLQDISPRTTLFILVWPFLVRWMAHMWRKSRR